MKLLRVGPGRVSLMVIIRPASQLSWSFGLAELGNENNSPEMTKERALEPLGLSYLYNIDQ